MSDIFDRLGTWIASALTGQAPGAAVGSVAGAAKFGTVGGFAEMLGLGASNDNYAKGAVTRAPLPNLTGMAGYIQQAATARGIDPDIALRVARSEGLAPGVWQSNAMKNGIREPSYGPFQLLKGGAGTGYPAGLGNDFMRQTGLDPANPANARAGVEFALDNAAKSGWGAWYGAKAAGVGKWQGLSGANPIGLGAEKAAAALDKMSGSATQTAQSLAGGLGKLGQSLSQFPAAPALSGSPGSGGGGLFNSFLGKLFGGVTGWGAAGNYLAANPGGYIGLFADGTENAPEGWAWVGERGPELRKLRGGA
ncbi:MAG: hypothetical protein EOS23_26495 [Mesorhizobium sp.]|nr:MAG: hypothetical protein EOS23_26495 [Mesorhizobium sp.]